MDNIDEEIKWRTKHLIQKGVWSWFEFKPIYKTRYVTKEGEVYLFTRYMWFRIYTWTWFMKSEKKKLSNG